MDVVVEPERMVVRRFPIGDVEALLAQDRDSRVWPFVQDDEPVKTAAVERRFG